jgi:hypothetical protein
VQLVGPLGGEEKLLATALHLEAAVAGVRATLPAQRDRA